MFQEYIESILGLIALFVAIGFSVKNASITNSTFFRKYLAIFLAAIGFIIAFFLILDFGYQNILLPFIPIFLGVLLSLSPVLWMYIKSITGKDNGITIRHFILPIGSLIISAILLIINTITKGDLEYYWIQEALLYFVLGSMSVVFILQSLYYIIKMIGIYRTHLKNIGEVFSYTERVNLSWLSYVIGGYLVFIAGLIIIHIVEDQYSGLLFNLLLLSYISYAGYHGLVHKPVFTSDAPKINTVSDSNSVKDISKVSETEKLFNELKLSILTLMNQDKIYLEESLTIHELAKMLNTNSKYISQVVNTKFEKTFVVFINEYRIEESKRLLRDEKLANYTMETIGYKSGFKSKSAFNNAFKKFTGITPSQYLKSISKLN